MIIIITFVISTDDLNQIARGRLWVGTIGVVQFDNSAGQFDNTQTMLLYEKELKKSSKNRERRVLCGAAVSSVFTFLFYGRK